MPDRRLADRVVLVTGAGGGGIGTATARRVGHEGAMVVVHGRAEHRPALDRLVAEIEADGSRARVAVGDLADGDQVNAVVDAATAWAGRLDGLVHNAAPSLPPTPIGELDDAQWRAETSVILDGAFAAIRAGAAAMAAGGLGSIVLVSSSAVARGALGRSAAYAAAKAGLHGLARQAALELGPLGIRANVVVPSQIDTPRIRAGGRRTDASLAAYAATVPLRRVGRPDDVAAAIAFLLSDDAGYITGEQLHVDGGSSLASPATRLVTAP